MRTATPRRHLSAATGGLLVAAAAYSWGAAALRPFTRPMDVAVAVPVVVVLAITVLTRGGSGAARSGQRRSGGAVWIGLVGALGTWELIAYLWLPRHDHPTLSSIADEIMSTHPGRALMFALWLALGWLLFARRLTGVATARGRL